MHIGPSNKERSLKSGVLQGINKLAGKAVRFIVGVSMLETLVTYIT